MVTSEDSLNWLKPANAAWRYEEDGMRILLVDDNKTNLSFLSRLVATLSGCEAVPFLTPADALAAMPSLDFDIGVLD